MSGFRTPSRQEIAKAVGDSPDMVRALEKVFQFSADTAPDTLNSIEFSPGSAPVNELAERVDGLTNLILMAAVDGGLGEVLSALESLQALALTMPAIQAQDDAPADIPPPSAFDGGANGTFTTSDPFTVTVVNGVITSIA